jgi:aminoglycoside/choline kinase family phosphotransferase
VGPVSVVSPSTTSATAPVDLTALTELVRLTWGADLVATPMPGGASTRRYFRLTLSSGKSASTSAVAMFVPEGGRPEEVQKAHDGTRWPFLEVRDLLAERGIDVPMILAEDTDRGWLVIEDLGDDTLANWLARSPSDKPALYTLAVTDLARAQRVLASLPAGSVVSSRTFDVDLLRWEVEHFREWGLEARGKPLADGDLARWNELAGRLAHRVSELPYGFVHRDYQSRNLMVGKRPDGSLRLVWIDFQDALLGPRVYDLVALLNDSYQEFDRAFVEARLAEYAASSGLPASESGKLVDEFDLVTVQRKLKDAGRFVFIDRMKNNPSFLKFVTPTIVKVGAALGRLAPRDPDMAALRDILRRALGDELGS